MIQLEYTKRLKKKKKSLEPVENSQDLSCFCMFRLYSLPFLWLLLSINSQLFTIELTLFKLSPLGRSFSPLYSQSFASIGRCYRDLTSFFRRSAFSAGVLSFCQVPPNWAERSSSVCGGWYPTDRWERYSALTGTSAVSYASETI